MQINTKYSTFTNFNLPQKKEAENFGTEKKNENYKNNNLKSINIRANYVPIAFKGNAPEIKNAFIVTKNGTNIPVSKTEKTGSYIVEKDSKTEVIYGNDAIKYLSRTSAFKYDTQIIFPKNSKGKLETDGKTIPLDENSGVLISKGTKAKITTEKGYPFVLITKKTLPWYDNFSNKSEKPKIQDKFFEIMQHNAHSFNGEFKTELLLPDKLKDADYLKTIGINKYNSENLLADITANKEKLSEDDQKQIDFLNSLLDKLCTSDFMKKESGEYYRFTKGYNQEYAATYLETLGLNKDEIEYILPILKLVRNLHMQTTVARQDDVRTLSTDTISKMKEKGILYNNKKNTSQIYWKKSYDNEASLRMELSDKGFEGDELEQIVSNWYQALSAGFDLSGLKFINSDIAVYNLNEKLNNWTLEETNWLTNSTALANKKGETPSVGVSMVQADEDRIYDIDELRKGEVLHSHPDLPDKHQTELYLITSGAAVMNIVKDGKTQLLKLKQGDLAVIQPGVQHCINSVKGEYEQIVVQIPSAFQYGFGFKQNAKPPKDYNIEELKAKAKEELS